MENKEEEIWKDIIGYEGLYQVSTFGNIKSLKRIGVTYERRLKHLIMPRGYHSVRLYKDGINKQFLIHRLVCIAFIDNEFNKSEVNHINSDINDNRLINLEWCTRHENIIHSYKYGKNTQVGIRNNKCKLSESDVLKIRSLIESGNSITELGIMFKVSTTHIAYIRDRKSWSHI